MHDQVDEEPGRILVEVLIPVGGYHVDGLGVGLVDVFTEVAGFREEYASIMLRAVLVRKGRKER